MNCKNCKYFADELGYDGLNFGTCKSPNWKINPDYYLEHEEKMESNMVEVTYNPIVGKDFGCIHFETNK